MKQVKEIHEDGGLLGREVNLVSHDDEGGLDHSPNHLVNLIERRDGDLIIGNYAGCKVAAQMQVAEY